MQYIGKSNKYYTLWQTDEIVVAGSTLERFLYCRNLSFSLEEAKKKVPNAILDENLRGTKPFWRDENKVEYPDNCFAFGRYAGEEFEEVDDYSYMRWYYTTTKNNNAGEVLLNVGYVFHNDKLLSPEYYKKLVKKEKNENLINSLHNDHHYVNGEKVELMLRQINMFSFDTEYGISFVVNYESNDGKLFKYIGGNPKEDFSETEFTKVRATIKHNNYNGVKETRLLRIKVL